MKNTTIVFIFLFAACSMSAQEVISTQGDEYSNATVSIAFTLGEVVTQLQTDDNYILTQGFHQGEVTVLGVLNHAADIEASVFPNPTQGTVMIKTNAQEGLSYTLYNLQGQVVMQHSISASETALQIGHLAPGNYTLTLSNCHELLKTFKLLKTL